MDQPPLRRPTTDPLLQMQGLLEVARLVRAEAPLEELLEGVATVVAMSLGFSTVAINLYRPADDLFEVTTVAGSPAAAEAVLHTTSTPATWDRLLVPEFEQDGAFLIPAGSVEWDEIETPRYVPPPRLVAGSEGWLPDDELFVPMRSSTGTLLGTISVDDPLSGRRPSSLTLQALATVGAHAALAIEQRQAATRASEHTVALDRLLEVSARLSQTLEPVPALQIVCDAVTGVLGFQEVALGLRRGEEIVSVAANGLPRERFVVPMTTLEEILDIAAEHEGTYLLTAEQVDHFWPGQAMPRTPGAGPHAWGGHQLFVPLTGATGEVIGLMSVAAPRNRLLPDPDRLHTLRMFASQAAATLHSAAQLALREERERAQHLASHDSLTGLPNRRALLDTVDGMLLANQPACLLFLDLDDFKMVNEALGHQDGDGLLRGVAERVRGAAEPFLVSRLGGDEFAVLLGGGEAEGRAVAARVHDALRMPFAVVGTEHRIGASIGIATSGAGVDGPELLTRADIAMYQAKSADEKTAFYDAATDHAASRLETIAALRGAADRGELELHYQPIVHSADHRPTTLEALLRWRRDGRLVPPLDFIGLAESSGLIESIGAWVIDEAAAQSRRWRDQGLEVPCIAVNVSPRQLRRTDLADTVAAALNRSALDPGAISVEITESALLPDLRVAEALQELRAIGVQCAIDDFGADYSSLHRLLEMPVDILKIDRAFLRQVPGDGRATGLLHAIIALASAIELTVVVEGVETDLQAQELRTAGAAVRCQGFHFARPMPADELADWLRERARPAALEAS